MSDPNIKNITLVSKGEEPVKKGGSRKKKMVLPSVTKGGGGTSPGTMSQLAASHIPGEKGAEPVGMNSDLTKVGAPLQTAGKAHVKVVLEAAKKKKVVLAAVKPVAAQKTRKRAARKVRMSMAGLSRKINVAKTIKEKASGDKIEEIKSALAKAGLIKETSKAPEEMLRQMYADYMMLKKRAL